MPLIQISDDNPTGAAVSHFRNVKVINYGKGTPRVLVNRGGGNRPEPTTPTGVAVYLHAWYGPGRDAKILSTQAHDYKADGLTYKDAFPLTGDESRAAEVKGVAFPKLLDPVDDLPPTTVVTHVVRSGGKVLVRGTTADNGQVTAVTVNGHAARALRPNFSEWEVALQDREPGALRLEARARDAAGNVEATPHILTVSPRR